MDEDSREKMGKPKLVPTRTKATAYNNSAIVFLGKFTTSVSFKGTQVEMEIEVTLSANHPSVGETLSVPLASIVVHFH